MVLYTSFRSCVHHLPGIVLVVMVFPVYWMISTAFKPTDEINGLKPTWVPWNPTLQHFRDAVENKRFLKHAPLVFCSHLCSLYKTTGPNASITSRSSVYLSTIVSTRG